MLFGDMAVLEFEGTIPNMVVQDLSIDMSETFISSQESVSAIARAFLLY